MLELLESETPENFEFLKIYFSKLFICSKQRRRVDDIIIPDAQLALISLPVYRVRIYFYRSSCCGLLCLVPIDCSPLFSLSKIVLFQECVCLSSVDGLE